MPEFVFTVTYFTPDGRRFRGAPYRGTARAAGRIEEPGDRVRLVPNMHDAAAALRGLRDCGGPSALPGMDYRDGWPGYIVVTHPESAVPGLVLPPRRRKRKKAV